MRLEIVTTRCLMASLSVTIAALAATAVALTPPAPSAFAAVRTSSVSVARTAPVCMLAKRGRPKKNAVRYNDAEDDDDDDELVETNNDEDRGLRMVDPMTTSLGREDELKPFPGPPVFFPVPQKGPRTLGGSAPRPRGAQGLREPRGAQGPRCWCRGWCWCQGWCWCRG